MTTKTVCALACMFIFGSAGAGTLQAQQVHGGAHVGWGFEDFGDFGVGLHAAYPLTDFFRGVADFTYYFPGEDVNFWEVNVNGHYLIQIEGDLTPYIGAGINYSRISFDVPDVPFLDSVSTSEFGFNVLGGVQRALGQAARIFAEARYVFSDLDQLVVTAGISFPIFTVD